LSFWFDEEEEEAKKRLSSSKYLNTHSKIDCAFAAYFLGMAKGNAIEATETMISDGFFHSMEFISRGFFFIGAAVNHHEGVLEKSRLASAIADIRHSENRSMKEQAIKYYKNHHESFANKDDAALQIAGKIVPVAFSTVRGWLKGVKPE
jgi:hypothetical protein